jgi:replicative DNA helicase
MEDSCERYVFSGRVQRVIAALVLQDWPNFALYREVIRPEYFESPVLEALVKLIFEFHKRYKRPPVKDELQEELVGYLVDNPRLPEDEFITTLEEIARPVKLPDFEYVKDKVVEFAKNQAVKAAMLESLKLLDQKNYAGIRSRMEAALSVGRSTENFGTLYFENLEARLAQRAAGETRFKLAIPTGLQKLDVALGGGLAPQELGIIMGPSKRGKTILAVNFALGAAIPSLNRRRGHAVVHYVLESNEARAQVLYDARISGISKDNVPNQPDDVRGAIRRFTDHESVGRIIIKQFPANSCSAWEIESHIQNLRVAKGIVPEVIFIDYLKLMRVADKNFKIVNDRYEQLGQVTKELLSLSQRYNLAIWVLHQSNKASFSKSRIDLVDSADSLEPVRDADVILTINPVRERRDAAGEMIRIYVAGGREIEDGKELDFYIDKGKVRVSEAGGNIYG